MADLIIEHTMAEIEESLELTMIYHKKLWMWLYDNPTYRKYHWPPFRKKELVCSHHCFLCAYAINQFKKQNDPKKEICELCPAIQLIVPLFESWSDCVDPEDCAELALQILTVKLKPWAEQYEIKI